jgi:hypothetical protein
VTRTFPEASEPASQDTKKLAIRVVNPYLNGIIGIGPAADG